ncbi:ATP-binding protein, partial [Nonomuraea sp. RK-328]|nr:ATP-binding protein [Nonomuraea sp. RK-328]
VPEEKPAAAGPTLPAAAGAETLLEPFVHGQGTRVRTDGSGLGLSIVRAVTLAHRGRIAVAARTGGGLDVTVDLPQSPPTVPSGAAASGEVNGAGAVR